MTTKDRHAEPRRTDQANPASLVEAHEGELFLYESRRPWTDEGGATRRERVVAYVRATTVHPSRVEWVVEEVLDVKDPGPSPLVEGEIGGFSRVVPTGWTPEALLSAAGLSRVE